MATKIKNLKKKVFALLPRSVSLTYIDYRDSIEDWSVLNEAVKKNDMAPIYEKYDDSFWEGQADAVDYVKKELLSDIQNKFDIEEDEAEEIIERYEDELRDEIYNRDDSTPIKDLLKNTGDQVFFYDTGITMPGYGESAAQYRLSRMELKKTLGIKEDTYDGRIDMMIAQASYGGNLVVYFRSRIEDLICEGEDYNHIEFSNAYIAIIDTSGGSGDDTEIEGHKFSLPFSRKNLFMDRAVSYSYTYEVCGMSSNWCDSTGFVLSVADKPTEINTSSINKQIEYDAKCDEVYKNGGCTPGDMKPSRHRNTYYINNYPCGNKCPNCGTFWID